MNKEEDITRHLGRTIESQELHEFNRKWNQRIEEATIKAPILRPNLGHDYGVTIPNPYANGLPAMEPELPKLNVTTDGHIQFINEDGSTVVDFNLYTAEIVFSDKLNTHHAARLFWETILGNNHAYVPRSGYERLKTVNTQLENELYRTKELLDKSLKELAKKYTEEA